MIARAATAITHWGGTVDEMISHRENAVFRARLATGEKVALRLHRPGYNSRAEIRSEIWWTRALARQGFPVPVPVFTAQGQEMVDLGDGLLATVLTWMDGAPLGRAGVPLGAGKVGIYRDLGALLARLHKESDLLEPPDDFTRRRWDIDGFLGDAPLWGRFWENPALSADERRLIGRARDKVRHLLHAYRPNADFGLIHADALRENVFQAETGLSLIDFDDSGFGFRIYDLAVAVSQSIGDAEYPVLRDALVSGYRASATLSPRDIEMFAPFAMLRCFASLGWAVSRVAPNSVDMDLYVKRAVATATGFLDNTT